MMKYPPFIHPRLTRFFSEINNIFIINPRAPNLAGGPTAVKVTSFFVLLC